MTNPFDHLSYEFPLENLGDDFYEIVSPERFPHLQLRFRNDALLPHLGLEFLSVKDQDFVDFFGHFQGEQSCLALKYHGHQFGQYNPYLGDGRGFLYGQIRCKDDNLYDFGAKGSGKTPFSQGRDGKLTLKGGIREVLASEMLHRLGIRTSRCLSLIETGELVSRDGDSQHRGAVMVRLSHSHLRFGTFERLNYYDRPDLIKILLDHVIKYYYPTLWPLENKYVCFYKELVQRFALLAAQWMAQGFCHGVLNTDNMSIVGESFDYGPYRFLDYYNPNFTAASFDTFGRYSYRNQPSVCRENLRLLQIPLSGIIPYQEMDSILESFTDYYSQFYRQIMLKKLGLTDLSPIEGEEILTLTLQFFLKTRYSYHHFFQQLRQYFSCQWVEDVTLIFREIDRKKGKNVWENLNSWCRFYHYLLLQKEQHELEKIKNTLQIYNAPITLLDSDIELIWQAIRAENNWQPFYDSIYLLQSVPA